MRVREGDKEKDILNAAVKVFAHVGFHNAKISRIAEVAGVATGSVYLYFRNKREILLKIFDKLWLNVYEGSENALQKKNLNPPEKIDEMIDILIDTFIESPSLALVFVNEQYHLMDDESASFKVYYNKFFEIGEEIIKEGIRKNIFSKSLDVEILRHYIIGGVRNLLRQWAREPEKYPLNKIRQASKYITKYGIIEK